MQNEQIRRDIFIIDDDEEVRMSTLALLQSQGMSVMLFNSAETFLSKTDNSITGCVISDFEMDVSCNGIELLKRMQANGYQLPVIIVSGSLNESSKTNAIRSGAYAVIEKPYPSQLLLETINSALEEF